MDPEEGGCQSPVDPRIAEVCKILWGNHVTNEIFQRWSQGFTFSADEPTALVQNAGGPCAVIAPMQAFILKYVSLENMREIEEPELIRLLVKAATDMLRQTRQPNGHVYLFRCKKKMPHMLNMRDSGGGGGSRLRDDNADDNYSDLSHMGFIKFHENVEIIGFPGIEQAYVEYLDHTKSYLTCSFGVLLFLYSVMLTRGLDELRGDLSDPSDSLIESTFGYGSQSLINLMLTGRAVGHVWDHEKNISGLRLQGLIKQSEIGFLTILEHHQLCEVGSFFKNPEYPIWVLGSDTHLTVLFSFDKNLVSKETPWEEARRVFKNYDHEGNNFIQAKDLGRLLEELNLVCEQEYVDIMRKKLDSEGLGIILLKEFMDEFFAEEKRSVPDTFTLWHYNGLAKSSWNNKVQYHVGNAVLLECHVKGVLESSNILTVLQTKWPSVDVQWADNYVPSLN